jgi:FkbM family methyltransferase
MGRCLARMMRWIPFPLEVDVKRDGVRYRLDLHEHAQRVMYLNLYERELRRDLLKRLPRGGCVVDVGANIGFWSLPSAVAVGPQGVVYAFEPNPWAIERLQRNIGLNRRLVQDTIEVVTRAAGAEQGWADLMACDLAAHASQASFYPPDSSVALQKVRVPVTRLDRIVTRHVNLLKIDVEGHEPEVLAGAAGLFRRSPPDYLVIEIHESNLERAGQTGADLTATIRDLGYREMGAADMFGTVAWQYQGASARKIMLPAA